MNKLLLILLFTYSLAVTTDDIYDNSWALIIGINKYENVQKLDFAHVPPIDNSDSTAFHVDDSPVLKCACIRLN